MRKALFAILLGVVFTACGGSANDKVLSETERKRIESLGDSITTLTQRELLKNVSTAIQQGGTDFAVSFCHTRATPLTDSLAEAYRVTISRLSDRNRNAQNAIDTEIDRQAWETLVEGETSFVGQDPDGAILYYKAIFMAMPTCLQCHGGESDISAGTLSILREKYPADKAVGYQAGDLRGMWKVELSF